MHFVKNAAKHLELILVIPTTTRCIMLPRQRSTTVVFARNASFLPPNWQLTWGRIQRKRYLNVWNVTSPTNTRATFWDIIKQHNIRWMKKKLCDLVTLKTRSFVKSDTIVFFINEHRSLLVGLKIQFWDSLIMPKLKKKIFYIKKWLLVVIKLLQIYEMLPFLCCMCPFVRHIKIVFP